MSQHDLDIANANGASFRSDLNLALKALGQFQAGASAPSPSGGLVAGQYWLDTTSSPYRLKVYNGTGWVEVLNFTTGGSPVVTVAGVGSVVQGYNANTIFGNVVNAYSRTQYFNRATLTDAATISWDLDVAQAAIVTLGGNRTLGAPSNPRAGAGYQLYVKQDGTGGRTLAWNATHKCVGGSAPAGSTAANALDLFTFASDGTNLYCVGTAQGF